MTVPEEAVSPVTAAMKAIIAVAYDFGHGNYVGGDAGKFARAAVQAAAPLIAAAERQRIRQLAIEHDAWTTEDGGPYHRDTVRRFATLLDAPAKETP